MYPGLAPGSSTPADDRYRIGSVGAQLGRVRTKIPLLQALGAASLSSPGAWAGARRGRGKPIGGEARCGGAHRRAWVRVRAHPRPRGSACRGAIRPAAMGLILKSP
eukprot:scaffold58777_cov65-Phaeocystis_antarctica.AAC.3